MRRWVWAVALALVLTAAGYGGYRQWVYEAPRASGPLSEALRARIDPDARGQALTQVIDAHIDPQAPLEPRRRVLEANGFDCVIRAARVEGSRELACRRPIEGTRYCERINYFAYQTAAGAIIENLAAVYRVPPRQRQFGRCPYAPPPLET